MEITVKQTVQIIAGILLTLVVTQVLLLVVFIAADDAPRQQFQQSLPVMLLWGLEAILFTMLTAFAGAAMLQAKNYHLGWSAIAFSAVFNLVQVSVGLAMFGTLAGDAKSPTYVAVVAFSFMVYYAAKLLLGFAALVFGMAKMNADVKTLGGLTVLVGAVAMFANAILIIFGRDGFLPSPVAGASGVFATLLLALCLISLVSDAKGNPKEAGDPGVQV